MLISPFALPARLVFPNFRPQISNTTKLHKHFGEASSKNFSIHRTSSTQRFLVPKHQCLHFRAGRKTFVNKAQKSLDMETELKLSDYDCIGFDLDNTLGEYQLYENSKLEFEALGRFLVDQRGYDSSILEKSFDSEIDFFQRGLMLDVLKGNILKLAYDGSILKACHGTTFMSEKEIIDVYGPEKKWEVATEFCKDMLSTWNGPMSEKMRTLLDYFDTPVSLIFGRAVDSVDKKLGKRPEKYTIWPDIYDCLCDMYNREQFDLNIGGYFPVLKANPKKYYRKCDPQVLNWLKELKKTKKLFVITGSNVDYASFTATHTLGENWRDYFDISVFYSRKPGFFNANRPFLKLDGIKEGEVVSAEDLQVNNSYSQGNWPELYKFLCRITGKLEPKCLYIGDNLVQDIFTPSEYKKCDTIALTEELAAESDADSNPNLRHPAESVIKSSLWGSYYYDTEQHKPTIWTKVINQYSKVCIPNIKTLSGLPIDYPISCFESKNVPNTAGFLPFPPPSLQKVSKEES